MKYVEVSDKDINNFVEPIVEEDEGLDLDDSDFTYYAMYKCPLCGEIFTNTTSGDRTRVKKAMYAYKMCGDTHTNGLVPECDIHKCQDGSLGLANFIGFKRIKIK